MLSKRSIFKEMVKNNCSELLIFLEYVYPDFTSKITFLSLGELKCVTYHQTLINQFLEHREFNASEAKSCVPYFYFFISFRHQP